MYLGVIDEIYKDNEKEDSKIESTINDDILISVTDNNLSFTKSDFSHKIYTSTLYLEEFRNHDFFEKYDKNKEYNYTKYKHDYGYGEKEYENILYTGSSICDSDLVEDEILDDMQDIDEKICYVVAKEIYNEEDMKMLEKYCECHNCMELKKYDTMTTFERTIEYIINKLIVILRIFLFFNVIVRYLYSCLKIQTMCAGCCGCLKCGRYSASTNNVTNARKKLIEEHSKKNE